jgi:hypothetical protein
VETTTNKAFTLDWSLLAGDERRSSGWLIGDEAPGPVHEQPLRILLAVLDLNLRRELALALRLDGHEVIEAEDPVDPQRYLESGSTESAVDVLICGTAMEGEGSKGHGPSRLIMLGRDQRTGAMNTLGKSLVQDGCSLG